jgi:hypothetical protein
MDEKLINSMLDIIKEYANEENWYYGASDFLDFGGSKKSVWVGTGTNGYDMAKFLLEEIENSKRSEINPTETDPNQLSLFENGNVNG